MDITKIYDLSQKQHPRKPVVVEIHSTVVDSFSGKSKTSGKPFEINKQTAYLHTSEAKYPREFQLQLEDQNKVFAKGFYSLHLEPSLEFDNFGSLGIDARKLKMDLIADF